MPVIDLGGTAPPTAKDLISMLFLSSLDNLGAHHLVFRGAWKLDSGKVFFFFVRCRKAAKFYFCFLFLVAPMGDIFFSSKITFSSLDFGVVSGGSKKKKVGEGSFCLFASFVCFFFHSSSG